MRQAWPAVLERVKQERRYTWMVLSNNAELLEARGDTITLGFTNAGARESFLSGGSGNVLATALAEVTKTHWRINAIMAGTAPQAAPAAPAAAPQPLTRPPLSQTVYAEDDSVSVDDADASPDDEDIIDADAAALLSSALGAELIAEEDEDV